MDILFVTSNETKFEIARKSLEKTVINVIRIKMDLDEIQSQDIEIIASKSAKLAYNELKKDVAVADSGFFIEALNGFPGAFIKYVNDYLTADDILRLMWEIENRKIVIKECISLIIDGKQYCFIAKWNGTIAKHISTKEGTTFEKIVIPEGYSKPLSEFTKEEQIVFWSNGSAWKQIAESFEVQI